MANIHVLSPHVANLIAAGEVVERPASAAKELIENAVDAGATAITVEIKSGGIAYLRVTDNGCGISREDVPTAFKRHSTSKIRNEEDLSHIGTLGFRGEALAAIASVSKIDLLTKQPESALGISLHLEGGTAGKIEDAGCPDGTTIVVRNLFYNTPARMKFLKRDAAEGAAVESVVQSAALSHPEISVKFIREGKQVLHTPGDSDLKSCVYSLFGRDIANDMLETKSKLDSVSVNGFVSKPIGARGNRMMQYFFVNGRAIKSRLLSAALDEAYKDSLMKGRYPMCVLFIEMPLEQVDVNVHPAKTEVKFAREREIFDAVYFAAKSGLNNDNGRQTVILDKVENHLDEQERVIKPNTAVFNKPNEEKNATAWSSKTNVHTASDNKMCFHQPIKPLFEEKTEDEITFENIKLPEIDVVKVEEHTETAECQNVQQEIKEVFSANLDEKAEDVQPVEKEIAQYRVVGEVLKTYIIVEQGESVLLIDKHAAHERVIFNKLVANKSQPQKQLFITPVVITLTQKEIVALMDSKKELEGLGFDFDEFGQDSLAIRQVPDGIDEGEAPVVMCEIAQALLDGKIPSSIEKLDAIRHSVACKAAIKAGKKSDIKELQEIVDKVMKDPEIRYCPHGRPVTVEMTRYQLEKQFKRVT